jgi:hypothetical protein
MAGTSILCGGADVRAALQNRRILRFNVARPRSNGSTGSCAANFDIALARTPSPDVSPRALSGLVSTRHEPPSVPHAWGFCFGICRTSIAAEKKPRLPGGARGALNSTCNGRWPCSHRPNRDYAHPIGRASGASIRPAARRLIEWRPCVCCGAN